MRRLGQAWQALSLTLGPMGVALEPSLDKVLSQQHLLLEPQETQSLLEPLGVCSQGGGSCPSPGSSEGPGLEDALVMEGVEGSL